jgi:hypothetical protein
MGAEWGLQRRVARARIAAAGPVAFPGGEAGAQLAVDPAVAVAHRARVQTMDQEEAALEARKAEIEREMLHRKNREAELVEQQLLRRQKEEAEALRQQAEEDEEEKEELRRQRAGGSAEETAVAAADDGSNDTPEEPTPAMSEPLPTPDGVSDVCAAASSAAVGSVPTALPEGEEVGLYRAAATMLANAPASLVGRMVRIDGVGVGVVRQYTPRCVRRRHCSSCPVLMCCSDLLVHSSCCVRALFLLGSCTASAVLLPSATTASAAASCEGWSGWQRSKCTASS